jgi:pimeloyl-ACP methyl ester carboxylesterase
MINAKRTCAFVVQILMMQACIVAIAAPLTHADDLDQGRSSIEIPMVSGRVDASELLEPICKELGIDTVAALDKLDWTIDTSSLLGRLQLGLIERATGGIVAADVDPDRLSISFDSDALEAKRLELEPKIRALIARFSGADGLPAANAPREYGIFVMTPEDGRQSIAAVSALPDRIVLLVHGLDDPGGMFDDLIPSLHQAGYAVALFDYPNDGPISESADLLATQLVKLRALGTARVDIVAKSMGGLVTRDLLTRPSYYNGDGRGNETLPAIDRFIMIGTPNHGSHMARFRVLLELGEHLPGVLNGSLDSGGADLDGRGEAGIDLLPNSTFLERLNKRPLSTHTRHTIIAGRISPFDSGDVDRWVKRMRNAADLHSAPNWLRRLADNDGKGLTGLAESTVSGLGDGLVTIESARLEGVDDFVIVGGNHVSMIVNFGDDVPPAIPIILDRLARE